jgi:hypothetical protein
METGLVARTGIGLQRGEATNFFTLNKKKLFRIMLYYFFILIGQWFDIKLNFLIFFLILIFVKGNVIRASAFDWLG